MQCLPISVYQRADARILHMLTLAVLLKYVSDQQKTRPIWYGSEQRTIKRQTKEKVGWQMTT